MERIIEEKPESIKSPERGIEKAVFIMYPDVRTTEGPDPRTVIDGKHASYFCQKVFDRYSQILQAYKRNGFKIIGVIYKDTLPDKFSPLYPQNDFDELLTLSKTIDEWTHENHKELLEEALEKINLLKRAKIILGGYHAGDCVLTMGKVLKRKSLKVKINAELTEEQGKLFVMLREANKIFSSSSGKTPEVKEVFEEEIKDNKQIRKRETRRIASLLKK